LKKKVLILIGILLTLSGLALTAFAEEKAPPDLAYIKNLEPQTLIIGQYIVYMPKLTQPVYDAAKLTASDSQGIYYKSEFAGGTWFKINDVTELSEIQLAGNTETVQPETLSAFYYVIQVPKDGKDLIFFRDAGASAARFDLYVKSLSDQIAAKTATSASIAAKTTTATASSGLTNPLAAVAGSDAVQAEINDLSSQVDALNTSAGRGPEKPAEKPELLTTQAENQVYEDVSLLKGIAADADKKGFSNLAASARSEVTGKLLLLMNNKLLAASQSSDSAAKQKLQAEAKSLSAQASELAALVASGKPKPIENVSAGELQDLVKDTLRLILSKAVRSDGAGAAGLKLDRLTDTSIRQMLTDALASIAAGLDPADTADVLTKSVEFDLTSIADLHQLRLEEKVKLLTTAHQADVTRAALSAQLAKALSSGNAGAVNQLLDSIQSQINIQAESVQVVQSVSSQLTALKNGLMQVLGNGSGSSGVGLSPTAQGDMKSLLTEMTAFEYEYTADIEVRILERMKERYPLLLDYEVERKNSVSLSQGVLTDKIRTYDAEINAWREYPFVDLKKIDLQFAQWKAEQGTKSSEVLRTKQELAQYLSDLKRARSDERNTFVKLQTWLKNGKSTISGAETMGVKTQEILNRLSTH